MIDIPVFEKESKSNEGLILRCQSQKYRYNELQR